MEKPMTEKQRATVKKIMLVAREFLNLPDTAPAETVDAAADKVVAVIEATMSEPAE